MRIIKKIIISIVCFAAVILCNNVVQAMDIDYNIDTIDETKYPGVKSQIQKMQKQHPNWTFKVLYTRLNWDDVIAGEYVGHGGIPSSLIQNVYNGEWICPICGNTLYDVSKEWYCASEKAIKYMMDPRNSLTEEYVFQFQDLSSSAGARAEIAKMTEGTFLNNDECIDAILSAAQIHNISPFHLVARIRQEQGVDGSGTMNGYLYITEKGEEVTVYNLFNIKVSGNSTEGFEVGAKFAYEQGWITRAASIKGGSKFLREKYLDKGQSTLYFQKYNVVDQTNLYKHQYMQNIRAANDEGNMVYKGYKNNEMLDSHFEFTIPLYENMPTNKCARPINNKELYYGSIASELIKININKNSSGLQYISGNVVIVEWINGDSNVPKTVPKMTIESTDGSVKQQIYVEQISGNTYYFDCYINNLDKNKKYKIYVELTDTNNIGTNKKSFVSLSNTILGNNGKVDIVIKDNVITFKENSYIGNINSELKKFKIAKNHKEATYVSGEIVVVEWVDGKSTVPKKAPKMRFKSVDGTINMEVFVTATGTNTYYFDRFIEGIDTSKAYYFEIESGDERNISENRSMNVYFTKTQYNDTIVGRYRDKKIRLLKQEILFEDDTYIGNINSELITFNVGQNHEGATYVSGKIVVVEWVDGKSTVPEVAPKMKFKSTDGTVELEVFVTATGTNTYYFDRFIEGIDTSKEYFFEIESGDERNISENRKMNVYFTQTKYNGSIVGTYQDKKIKVSEQKIIFEEN